MSNSTPTPNTPSKKELEDQLIERHPNLFDGISSTKKDKILNSMKNLIKVEVRQEVTQSSSFSGPVPPPDLLKEYINVNPEFAQLIINMSTDEQKYSHQRDNKLIDKSFESKKRGQDYALVITLAAIIGGVICILFDHEISGGIISGVGLTGLVKQFLGKPGQKGANSNSDVNEE